MHCATVWRSQGEPFGHEQVAAKLAHFVRTPPSPQEMGAFPTEKGVIPTPEEEARDEEAGRKTEPGSERPPLTRKKLTVHQGATLRAARLKIELTQADVAERVGMATEVYGRMERGNLTPSVPRLQKLCLALRVDANAALGLDAREGAEWRRGSDPGAEDPPQLRRMVRALRQLDGDHLAAVSSMVHTLAQHS